MIVVTLLSLLAICGTAYFLIMCPDHHDCLLERIALAGLALAAGIGLMQYLTGYIDFNPVSRTLIWAMALMQLVRTYKLVIYLYDTPIEYENQQSRSR